MSTEAEVDAYLKNPVCYPVGMFDDTFDPRQPLSIRSYAPLPTQPGARCLHNSRVAGQRELWERRLNQLDRYLEAIHKRETQP